jgi:formylglycine-generating enzyme required for sulfatase activity
MWWLAGCDGPGPASAGAGATDSTRPGDTAETGAPAELDADGDGAPSVATAADPATADCDDADPTVTPATERYVAAGPFTRGSEEGADTVPVTTIELSAYCIDVYEVTVAAYFAFLQERGGETPWLDDDGATLLDVVDPEEDEVPERIFVDEDGVLTYLSGYEEHPVNEVTYRGAELFCAAAGAALPTEAQWEKAARGDDARTWPWGEAEPDCELMNYAETVGWDEGGVPNAFEGCVEDTMPVGSYPGGEAPSGARDLAGNISEWVADWYRADAYSDGVATDPPGPESGEFYDEHTGETYEARVQRGGSFRWVADAARTYARFADAPEAHSNGVGFRCARAPG